MNQFVKLPGNPHIISVANCIPGTRLFNVSTTVLKSVTVYSRFIAWHDHHKSYQDKWTGWNLQVDNNHRYNYNQEFKISVTKLTPRTESLPDCTGTCRNEYTHGWRKTSAISSKCSSMKGGFVMPIRSMVLLSDGSSATMAFSRIGRLAPISRPDIYWEFRHYFKKLTAKQRRREKESSCISYKLGAI